MQRVLFSIFDPFYRHPGSLFGRLRRKTTEVTTDSGYYFVDSPFASMQHPLLMKGNREAILRNFWHELAKARDTQILPALTSGVNVVIDGLGLDAFIAASARATGSEYDDLTALHHEFVRTQLKAYGISPPIYLLQRMKDMEWESSAISKYLPMVSAEDAAWYPGRARDIMKHYFSDDYGQLTPYKLEIDYLRDRAQMAEQLLTWAFNIVTTGSHGDAPQKQEQLANV